MMSVAGRDTGDRLSVVSALSPLRWTLVVPAVASGCDRTPTPVYHFRSVYIRFINYPPTETRFGVCGIPAFALALLNIHQGKIPLCPS